MYLYQYKIYKYLRGQILQIPINLHQIHHRMIFSGIYEIQFRDERD